MEHQYGEFAGLYDKLMQDVDYGAWAAYIDELIQMHLPNAVKQQTSIVDCACGTGAVTIPLCKRGYNMTGMDISPDMLRIASSKAMAQGLRIPFVQRDMRALAVHRPVDVVTACCDGVNYLQSKEDVRAFFVSAHSVLKPNGLLLFDLSSAYKLECVLGGHTFGEAEEDCAYLWCNSFDNKTRLLQMDLTFFVREGGLYRRFEETHLQRAHTRDEVERLLTDNGFALLGAYDAFSMEPPGADSERIQWAARRN